MSDSSRRLRVLTVNTHKGFTPLKRRFILRELREAVHTVAADVVFLQEVHGTHERHGARIAGWPAMSQYEFIADRLWPQFAYGRNAVYPEGDHGNAILSKFPIVRHHNLDVSVVGNEPRSLLHCVLRPPDWPTDLHAVCVHLGLRESHRRDQLRRLASLLDSGVPVGEPVIVAGDFNDWRGRAHRPLTGVGLHEVFVAAHGRAARTFPARRPVLRLDRIYVRGAHHHAPFTLPRRPWSHLSDHVPLAAEIQL